MRSRSWTRSCFDDSRRSIGCDGVFAADLLEGDVELGNGGTFRDGRENVGAGLGSRALGFLDGTSSRGLWSSIVGPERRFVGRRTMGTTLSREERNSVHRIER